MQNTHLGIIGGGQLGMLLVQAAIDFPIHVSVYDPNPQCPAAKYTNSFIRGEFDDHEAILEFGKNCDAIIYELEKVNVDALIELEKMGKTVISKPSDLKWIQDKGTQRTKLKEKNFPSPEFTLVEAANVRSFSTTFPIVQKWRTGGYDGYGVQIHESVASLQNAPEVDSVFEQMVDIKTELSIIVARDALKNTLTYPPVEMVFDPQANLVDHLIAPARVPDEVAKKAKELALKIAEEFDFHGVYAIEMFLTNKDKLLINEIAPRTHNSGHHTTAANVTSQYEQQIRIALNLPLESTALTSPCVLVNLLADSITGKTNYQGLEEAYKIPNTKYVLYGKEEVKPKRKMGHAIILDQNLNKAINKIQDIRNTLTITSHE